MNQRNGRTQLRKMDRIGERGITAADNGNILSSMEIAVAYRA